MSSNKKSIAFLIGTLFGLLLSASGVIIAERGAIGDVPFNELRTFSEVFGRIQKDYVEPVSDKKILEDAIRGMLAGLDPHSTYLDQEQYKELRVGTTGQFGGLGIEVGLENGFIKIISPIDDTPAQKAGVKAGDLIIRIDDKPVKGMSLEEAVKIMRGEPGSSITLTVVREHEEQPLTITIVRDVINVKSVKSRLIEDGYGYVRITSFQSRTSENLIENLRQLEKTNKGKLKGLVLDLRNNPGGVLNSAVAVSDAFLTAGLIVYTEGRIEDSRSRFNASPKEYLDGAPIVVLINAGSASASEIVAGALQDQHRAIIMGEKSFGKGSVQTILPTSNGGAVKLTTARYYTPSGRSIQAEGITPDIILSKVRLQEIEKPGVNPITESDLTHHLTNGTDEEGVPETNAIASDPSKLTNDYPLSEALNVLKGISISRAESN
ncbi:MAG: S41 family peptidase [Methylococcales bacterium]